MITECGNKMARFRKFLNDYTPATLEEQLNNTDEEEEEKREQIQTQLDEKKGQIESLGSD